MPRPYYYKKQHVPWNKGTGGCKRGHDVALYVQTSSGAFVCLGCKRENSRLYKRRRRGLEPTRWELRVCACGCGGHPKKANWLPGHNRRSENPIDKSERGRQWRVALRLLVLSHYGVEGNPVCVSCGFADIRALSIDHINGNGNSHRKQIKKWLYLWLKQQGFPVGYQTLCMNCQMIKAVEKNEHPTGAA